MRIVITGGAGFIGSHTAIKALESNHELLIIDDFSNSSKFVLDKIKYLSGKSFLFQKCNIVKKNILKKIFFNFKPQTVIHFAGIKSVEESIRLPLNYYENNLVGTLNLLEAMNENNCYNIIFSSSATVYGIPKYLPCDEKHPISPINPYGRSKYFSEEIIKDWTSSRIKNKSIILRYFNPVGAHKSGLIGENPKGKPNNLFPYISDVIKEKFKNLSIYGNDYETKDGTGVRDYIHVEDLAQAHVNSLNLLSNKIKSETINLGTGIGYSVLEIINQFEKTIQTKIPFIIEPKRSGDVGELVANNTKAFNLLEWGINNGLQEICEDTLRWIKTKN
tara:strand:- start:2865 stop:3863 length:999 start_codon:yes stop_codon:yes gene_type:complete